MHRLHCLPPKGSWAPRPSIHLLSRMEVQPKTAAVLAVRFHPHTPAHLLNRFAHDGQPDPRALKSSLRIHPFKHLEDALLVLRFDADPIILKPHSRFRPLSFGIYANARSHSIRHKLGR